MNQNVKKLLCCDGVLSATHTWGSLGDEGLPHAVERKLNAAMIEAADAYLAAWKAATAEMLEDLDNATG